jgi:hypothetical protein
MRISSMFPFRATSSPQIMASLILPFFLTIAIGSGFYDSILFLGFFAICFFVGFLVLSIDTGDALDSGKLLFAPGLGYVSFAFLAQFAS